MAFNRNTEFAGGVLDVGICLDREAKVGDSWLISLQLFQQLWLLERFVDRDSFMGMSPLWLHRPHAQQGPVFGLMLYSHGLFLFFYFT